MQQSILNKLRKNKFTLILTIPKILKDIDRSNVRSNELVNLDSLQYSVYGTAVPKVSIPTIPMNVMGQIYNVTSQVRPAYSPITVNFTIDNRFNNYWILWKWLTIINDPRNSGMNEEFAKYIKLGNDLKMTGNYLGYQTNIVTYIEDEYNTKIAKIDYYNAFITDLGEISYNYREIGELESYFTFVFNQMDIKLLE